MGEPYTGHATQAVLKFLRGRDDVVASARQAVNARA